jgi:serine/threonine protein kinase
LLEKEELIEDQSKGYSYWLPKSSRVRIIDFGGATLYNEAHSTVICTRQYRPPEVIMECCEWNEIADIWSIGCIIVELLTGDLLFPTHSDSEHLVMIEKNSGKFPQWMINKTGSSSLRRLFRDGAIHEPEAERQL